MLVSQHHDQREAEEGGCKMFLILGDEEDGLAKPDGEPELEEDRPLSEPAITPTTNEAR